MITVACICILLSIVQQQGSTAQSTHHYKIPYAREAQSEYVKFFQWFSFLDLFDRTSLPSPRSFSSTQGSPEELDEVTI